MFDELLKYKSTLRCLTLVLVASSCSAGVVEEHPPKVSAVVSEPLVDKSLGVSAKKPAPEPKAAPPTEPLHPKPLVVAVISDMNSSYGSTSYTPEVQASIKWLCEVLRPDLVIGTGDMVAGMKEGLDYKAMWTSFHAEVTDRLNECGLTFAPSPGNHDAARAPRFLPERTEYVEQWVDRRPDVNFVSDEMWPLRYAFRARPNGVEHPALFISLDLTTPRKLPNREIIWLDKTLAKAAGPVVVFGHVPLVPVARGRENEASNDARLTEVLSRRQIDVFLHGHHHAFYPHITEGVPTISMPNLGTGARSWIGSTEIGGNGLVVLTISENDLQWQAYRVPNFEPWLLDSLPEALPVEGHKVRLWKP